MNRISTVCIDCRYIGARPSGIGEVVRGLVDHAPALAPDLHFLLLKSPDAVAPLSRAANVTEQVVPAKANSPATMWMLPEIADLAGVDLFHATYNTMPARLAMPVVTTVHDIMWLTHPHWCEPGVKRLIKEPFYAHGIRRALARSAHIATVSAATRDAILAYDPALADRVSVTLSGVAPRFAPVPRDNAVLSRFGVSAQARYVLVVGQYAPYKNHERALEAFARAFAGDGAMRLIMVQRQGPNATNLEQLAERLGIGAQVRFTGGVEEPVLIQLYSHAAALLHPSLCEGFGNPLAEAMACGCPVITSNRSAMPEVTGGAARLVDPLDVMNIASALREVCGNEAIAAQMRAGGLARAAELGWASFSAANVAIYREALAST